jgi:uncharacterized protein DUF5343
MMGTAKLGAILTAIQSAQAPPKFNRTFLENLGFTSSGDRLVINMLKAVGLLSSDGTPTDRYFHFLDQTQAQQVLAEGIREAYSDLFQLNRDAQDMPKAELKGKIKTLTQGKVSDNVVEKMAITFQGLVKHADFNTPVPVNGDERGNRPADSSGDDGEDDKGHLQDPSGPHDVRGALPIAGLVYTINLQLPESRDQAVYDALFKSLRAHLTR